MRFKERWPKVDKNSVVKNPEKTIRKFLVNAREIKKKPIPNVRAIIKYKTRAKYFEKDGWIFVVNEEMTTVLTVELFKDCPEIWERNSEKIRKARRKK